MDPVELSSRVRLDALSPDFITMGPPESAQCCLNLHTAMSICKKLGLPLHPGKCVGSSTQLVVLGIELDSVELCARLAGGKLAALQDLICSWRSHRWCSWGQLESLIGHLQHAKVVWPGRTFLCHMIDLLCCFHRRDHPIQLSAEFHLDLLWWNEFFVKFEQSIASCCHSGSCLGSSVV